jgi:hypothetical protein
MSFRRSGYLLLVLALLALPTAAAEPEGPQNLTYDVWVSASFNGAPFDPFHDCARFSGNEMCLDGCGDCGPLVIVDSIGPAGAVTLWQARLPCGGLNLVFAGTSFDGLSFGFGGNVIGGSGAGLVESSAFGIEGQENAACSVVEHTEVNRYRTPRED